MKNLLLLNALILMSVPAFAQEEPSEAGAGPGNREVHVVCLYEGIYVDGNKVHGGRADVMVDRPGKEVTLVLGAYSPVTWRIERKEKTTITKVILCGYHRQAVEALPAEAVLEERFREGEKTFKYIRIVHSAASPDFRFMLKAVRKMTGREISSFKGMYRPESSAPLKVDSVQDDPVLASNYPVPALPENPPKLGFKALRHVRIGRPEIQSSIGDFTLAGPKPDTLAPLPRDVCQIECDDQTGKHFGITMHHFVEVDLKNRKSSEIDIGKDVPPLSWPQCIAIDSKRRRIVVFGSQFTYFYGIDTCKWTAIEGFRTLFIAAAAYMASDDRLFAVGVADMNEESPALLIEMNPECAVLRKTPFEPALIPGILGVRPDRIRPQLVSAGGHLVLLASLETMENPDAVQERFMYLINPGEKKVWLAWKEGG